MGKPSYSSFQGPRVNPLYGRLSEPIPAEIDPLRNRRTLEGTKRKQLQRESKMGGETDERAEISKTPLQLSKPNLYRLYPLATPLPISL